MNFSITVIFIKTLQFSIISQFQIRNNSINTVKKASVIEHFIDPLVASYIAHLYTLVCDSLDVTFGIKTTHIV